MKLPKDENLFDSWEQRLLQLYIDSLCLKEKTDTVMLDSVVKSVGGEDIKEAGVRAFSTNILTCVSVFRKKYMEAHPE